MFHVLLVILFSVQKRPAAPASRGRGTRSPCCSPQGPTTSPGARLSVMAFENPLDEIDVYGIKKAGNINYFQWIKKCHVMASGWVYQPYLL